MTPAGCWSVLGSFLVTAGIISNGVSGDWVDFGLFVALWLVVALLVVALADESK